MSVLTAGRRGPSPTAQQVAPGVWLVTLGRGAVASNVYLVGSESTWTLIDAGWASSAAAIRGAAEAVFGLGARPAAIVLTHIHPDHSGSAGQLARSWEVPVYVHTRELAMAAGRYLPQYAMPLDRWLVVPLMGRLPSRTRARIEAAGDITAVVQPLDLQGGVPGLPDWAWVPTPGHTPGHVAYLRSSDGVLIAGDAALTVDLNSLGGVLVGRQRVAGPPRYTTWDWSAAKRSIKALAGLEPRVLLPGHGRPLTAETAAALHTLARGRPCAHRRVQGLLPRYSGGDRYRPPPRWYARLQWLGLRAVLTRFVVTDLIGTLPQALLGRRPFTPTRLPIPPQRHYRNQLLYLPAFGVAVWLLMGGATHSLLRLADHQTDLGRVLDVVGLGMLVPMPPLWAADMAMLATDTFRLPGPAVTHALVQLWETALFAVGLHTVLGVPWPPAVLAGVAASGVYVLLGARLVR